jgi:hypothetical protein
MHLKLRCSPLYAPVRLHLRTLGVSVWGGNFSKFPGMTLSVIQIRNAKPRVAQHKLYDDCGLFIIVKPTGARLWRLKYRYGKRAQFIICVYPQMGLKEARLSGEKAHKNSSLEKGVETARPQGDLAAQISNLAIRVS